MYGVLAVLFGVASTLLAAIDGACVSYTKDAPTAGKPVTLDCVYRDGKRIPVNRSFLDLNNCLECTCKMQTLECCGMEGSIGTFVIPGCKIIKQNCTSIYVDATDPTKPCPYDVTTSNKMPEVDFDVTSDPSGQNDISFKNDAQYLYSNGVVIPLSLVYKLLMSQNVF